MGQQCSSRLSNYRKFEAQYKYNTCMVGGIENCPQGKVL